MPRIVNKIGDGYSFPLGLPYISSSLKKAGLDVVTYNLNHHEGAVDELLSKVIIEERIDVVMTGGLSFQYYPIKQLIDAVKKTNKQIPIFVGGRAYNGRPRSGNEGSEKL